MWIVWSVLLMAFIAAGIFLSWKEDPAEYKRFLLRRAIWLAVLIVLAGFCSQFLGE